MHACISNLLGTQSGYIIKITFEILPHDLCNFLFFSGSVRLLSIPDLFCVFTFFFLLMKSITHDRSQQKKVMSRPHLEFSPFISYL